jgi:hypothetical protein
VTREQWRDAKTFLVEAIGLDAAEQERLVHQRCPGDATLQQELIELLRCHTLATVRLPMLSAVVSGGDNLPGNRRASPEHDAPPFFERQNVPVFESGEMCGRHRVIRSLGTGAMGEVYLAEDTELRTPVALKVLSDAWLESPEGRTHLRREARRAAELRGHPHIATLHDIVEVVDVKGRRLPVMVMEYIDGAPASAIVAEGPVRVARAVRWAIEIASAIEYAHDRGVLHCDLKPSNVQITRDDHAKVLDFGIARTTYERGNGKDPVAGTPAYMAPEQLVEGSFTEAGDIYSLGVTLFELVTGRRPFEAPTMRELMLDVIGGVPPKASSVVPSLTPQLDAILDRALAKLPRQRYQSASEFKRELSTLLEADLPRDKTAASSSRWLAYSGAVSLCIVVVTALGFVTSQALERGLGITNEFAPRDLTSWFVWGLRSLIAPAVFSVVLFLAFLFAASVIQLVSGAPGVRGFMKPLRGRVTTVSRNLASLPSDSLGRLLLLAHVLILVVLALFFSPLIGGFINFMTAARGPIDSLRPSNQPMHELYGYFVTSELLVFCIGWYRLLRLRTRRREHTGAAYIVAGAAAIVVSLFLFTARFRILSHNEYERVIYTGQTCYLVEERASTALLFCPLSYPRNILANLSQVEKTGRIESIFSVFDPS